jgi:hypothetical protein
MPEVETWTTNPFPVDGGKGRIKHIGINFGAPGARRATDGAMWVEFPPIVAGSLPLGLEITGDDLAYYRRHASVAGGELPWVACSGANGVARVKLTLPTASDEDSANSQDKESSYTLRLHFAEPEEAVPGRRLFDVLVQERLVLPDVDVLADAGAAWVGTSRTISGIVPSDGHVTIDFRPHQSGMRPILAGLEVIAE